MEHDRDEDWRELCKAAANEPDPEKLMVLVDQINRALDERGIHRHLPEETGSEI
jgi:hypothetical protein